MCLRSELSAARPESDHQTCLSTVPLQVLSFKSPPCPQGRVPASFPRSSDSGQPCASQVVEPLRPSVRLPAVIAIFRVCRRRRRRGRGRGSATIVASEPQLLRPLAFCGLHNPSAPAVCSLYCTSPASKNPQSSASKKRPLLILYDVLVRRRSRSRPCRAHAESAAALLLPVPRLHLQPQRQRGDRVPASEAESRQGRQPQ